MTDTLNIPTISENDEVAIKAAANQIIADAARKGGYTVDQIPQEAKDDAYRYAKAKYIEDESLKSNPMYAQLQAEREAHRLTQMRLNVVSQTRSNTSSNVKSGPDPNVVRAQLGEGQWRALTDNGRLQVCGINPATVTPLDVQEAKKAFGRGPDTHFASNLSKQDWGRYQYLKRLAIVSNIQGQ